MVFASREDAGRKLGRWLLDRTLAVDLVVGLPRGGVVVAAEVARVLERPLEVLVVRKIGHPFHREFAVGALAEQDVLLLDEEAIGPNPALRGELGAVIEEERKRLASYLVKFHRAGACSLVEKSVLLVDDGLATGATIEAAILSARKQQAARVLIAAPVASTQAMERLQKVADTVLVLLVDPDFEAVGRYYECFNQTTDDEVLECLG